MEENWDHWDHRFPGQGQRLGGENTTTDGSDDDRNKPADIKFLYKESIPTAVPGNPPPTSPAHGAVPPVPVVKRFMLFHRNRPSPPDDSEPELTLADLPGGLAALSPNKPKQARPAQQPKVAAKDAQAPPIKPAAKKVPVPAPAPAPTPAPAPVANGKPKPKPPAPTTEDGDGSEEEDLEQKTVDMSGVPAKKKKKKKKNKNNKPSGFEEFFVEGPMTKDEVDGDLERYAPTKPFAERIELCIQRYRSKRKWDQSRTQLFDTYLSLGGIKSGQKQFSGGGIMPGKLDHLDAEQIQQLTTSSYIQREEESDEWEVAFDYIARGYLSYKVPYVLSISNPVHLEAAANLVRNFLCYIVTHSVCPEFLPSIQKAIKICDIADTELPLCRELSNRFPGRFNTACSALFDGYYAGMHDEGDDSWTKDAELPEYIVEYMKNIGMSKDEATKVFKSGLRLRGTAEQQAAGVRMKIKTRKFMSMKVTEIQQPTFVEPVIEGHDISAEPCSGINALGKLVFKTWIPEDVTATQEHLDSAKSQPEEVLELWLEKSVLQFCFVGMHVDAQIHTFDNGLRFMDNVTGVMTSFFLRLDTPTAGGKDDDDDDGFD